MRTAIALLALLAFSGCGNLGVQTQAEPGADFSTLRTWAFAPAGTIHEGTRLDPAVMDAQVAEVVRDRLTAKGFAEVGPDQADFWLGYKGELHRRTSSTQFEAADTMGRSAWASGGSSRTYMDGEEGSLELVMLRPRSTEVLWRGRAQATVIATETQVERVARVREAVRRMLEEFPPGSDDS